ncbi:MAG: hypothetical protein ACLFQJ_10850, partial [Campylobacterales bacterium]
MQKIKSIKEYEYIYLECNVSASQKHDYIYLPYNSFKALEEFALKNHKDDIFRVVYSRDCKKIQARNYVGA